MDHHIAGSITPTDDRLRRVAFVTVVANNYLHYAKTLMSSVRDHEPQASRYCVIADRDTNSAADLSAHFQVIRLEQLGLPAGESFMFQYSILELCTGVKPWALAWLLDRGYDEVIYLDPDILVYCPLKEIHELLCADVDIVLTPHLLAPVEDQCRPSELQIRQCGAYNLGFCAVRASESCRAFVAWWQSKLAKQCVVDIKRGIFVDQSWVDLVPGLFPGVAILRNPGYNVAYWNIAQRAIKRGPSGEWTANDTPLTFFHFSGIDPGQPEGFSRHQDRFTLATLGVARDLVLEYAALLQNNGAALYAGRPYGYSILGDGTPIVAEMRRLYRENERVRRELGDFPFDHPDAVTLPTTRFGIKWHYALREHAGRPLFSGFSPVEPDVETEGVWVADRASVLFPDIPSGRVNISGVYFPQAIELASGRASCELRIMQGKYLVHQQVLAESGPFCIDFELPPGRGEGARLLSLSCSSWFVPMEIGINSHDPRRLSWRIKHMRVGEIECVDCSRVPVMLSFDEYATVRGVNLVGYVNAESGVGEAARCWARAAAAAGIAYSLLDVGYQNRNLQRDGSVARLASAEPFDVDLFYVNADQAQRTIRHVRTVGRLARIAVGFWHWEQPRLPLRDLAAFDGLDEIWVASAFVQEAVARISPVPVFKLPHAIEFSVAPDAGRAAFGLPEGRFLVLVMFDFDSYRSRKNPDAAIKAFRIAAKDRPQAMLVIKTVNAHLHAVARSELEAHCRGRGDTTFIDDALTRQQTYDLEACCDCMISLHRAEGFGLGLAEMMYLGKPVIATGWSGNMEFMTPMNSFPVRYELVPRETKDGAYEAGQVWAEPDIDHAAECLGRLIDSPSVLRDTGDRAAASIREQLSPQAIGIRCRERLALLAWEHSDA